MIDPGERGAAVAERTVATEWEVGLGDTLTLAASRGGPRKTFTLVGIFESQRLADFQRPSIYFALADLQALRNEPGQVTAIDILLKDPSPAAMQAAQGDVERLIAEQGSSYKYRVESAGAMHSLLEEGDRITRLLLMLHAFVAMATSFFLIVTTIGMGLFARTAQLGTLRCVGTTIRQLGALVILEVMPLGLVGLAGGVLLGWALVHWVPRWADAGIPVPMDARGVTLGLVSGFLTTAVCCLVLTLQVCRISPLSAIQSQARTARRWVLWLMGSFGLALILLHEAMVAANAESWLSRPFAATGALSLYWGYILLAPLLIVWLGPVAVGLVRSVLGLPRRLAVEHLGQSPWRATGVCWVLLVGISAIVYSAVNAEVVRSVWDFPNRLPDAFVWTTQFVSRDAVERVRKLPGVKDVTAVADVDCLIQTHGPGMGDENESLLQMFLKKLTRPVFVAGEPERLLRIVKIEFLEGSLEDALGKLKKGGYVLIPVQTARQLGLKLGDRATITVRNRSAEFEIAGVVQSPALDLAVTAFQATSYMQFATASAMLGTSADLRDRFGLDAVSMLMVDLAWPTTPPPPAFHLGEPLATEDNRLIAESMLEWVAAIPEEGTLWDEIGPELQAWLARSESSAPPEKLTEGLARFRNALRYVAYVWERQDPEGRWARFRERLGLSRIAYEIGRPEAIIGSLRRLHEQVQKDVARATVLLTWLPGIVLVVAAVGIANLFLVSTQIRARQFAMLRALGAVKSQIVRVVLAEAIAVSLLGSAIGVAHGLHLAGTDHRITAGLTGFRPEFVIPLGTMALAAGMTVTLGLAAAVLPAGYASRENVLAALARA